MVLLSSGQRGLEVTSAMIALTCVSLGLRFLARSKSKAGFKIEDGFILLSAALFFVYCGLLLQSIFGPGSSGSLDYSQMLVPQLDFFLWYLYWEEMLFVLTIAFVKISILCFYRSVFSTQRFRQITLGLIALNAIWVTIAVFIVIFQCNPIKAAWTYELQYAGLASCFNSSVLVFAFEVINVVIDIVILCLPIAMIRKLQLPTKKKIGICAIFLLGGFICVTCAVRMYFVYDPKTGSPLSTSGATDWATVELATAIVCANLPCYGPLLNLSNILPKSIRTWYSSMFSTFRSSKGSHSSKSHNTIESAKHNNRYNQLGGDKGDRVKINYSRENGSTNHSHNEVYHMHQMRAERGMDVV